jgi:hypothetical protein
MFVLGMDIMRMGGYLISLVYRMYLSVSLYRSRNDFSLPRILGI